MFRGQTEEEDEASENMPAWRSEKKKEVEDELKKWKKEKKKEKTLR